MRYALTFSALLSLASAHGVVLMSMGNNSVNMPGLSLIDGTPRNCSSNGCGSQADTAIQSRNRLAAMPLGKTQGNGKVDAATAISRYMGQSNATAPTAAAAPPGVEDNLSGLSGIGATKRNEQRRRQLGQLLGGLLGGGGGGGGGAKGAKGAGTGAGAGAAGGNTNNRAAETLVRDMAGAGASKGMPTTDSNGVIKLAYRQINQDGAGPVKVDIDGTSCGTDNAAFKSAQVMQNVPGVAGLSLRTETDYTVEAKMPAGMTCQCNVGGASNVCIARVINANPQGFGGSAAFTQSTTARKRAVAYRLKKRMAEHASRALADEDDFDVVTEPEDDEVLAQRLGKRMLESTRRALVDENFEEDDSPVVPEPDDETVVSRLIKRVVGFASRAVSSTDAEEDDFEVVTEPEDEIVARRAVASADAEEDDFEVVTEPEDEIVARRAVASADAEEDDFEVVTEPEDESVASRLIKRVVRFARRAVGGTFEEDDFDVVTEPEDETVARRAATFEEDDFDVVTEPEDETVARRATSFEEDDFDVVTEPEDETVARRAVSFEEDDFDVVTEPEDETVARRAVSFEEDDFEVVTEPDD